MQFGGVSWSGGVAGAWRSPSGRVYRDRNRQYTVSLERWSQFPDWLDVIRWVRERFRQEAIYIKVAGVPEVFEE